MPVNLGLGRAVAVLALVLLGGCAVGPNYRRPAVEVPPTTRGAVTEQEAASLADLPWWDVFEDPVLQSLVAEALRENRSLQAAIARVEQSRQLVGVARADLLPQIGYQAQASRERLFLSPGFGNRTGNVFLGAFNLAWEVDIWGRIRRATESARAEYLGSEEFRRGVMLSLVSDVAQAYYELLELDRDLAISRLTAETFQKTVDLFGDRYRGGIATLLDVSRGEASLAGAAATIPAIESQIVAKENQLSILLGRTPGPIARGQRLESQTTPPRIPAGIPAALLERRPDVRAAEQAIVAANANVGVAVGNFLPRIGLTSLYGGQSSEIENIVKGTGNVWAVAGSFAGPLFQGGRLLASYRASEAAWQQAVEQYRETALTAFAEVSSTLVANEKLRTVRVEKDRQVSALGTAVQLSLDRYNEGIATYFEVLEAQQQYFEAQLTQARTIRDQLTTVVQLYRALGGGWNLEDAAWAPADDVAVPADAAPAP